MTVRGLLLRGLNADSPVSLRLFGLTALALLALGLLFPSGLARAFVAGWIVVISAGMGASILLHTHRLTGGRFGVDARPALEGLAATVPFAAVLGLLLLVLQPLVWPWASGAGLELKPDVAALYLNPVAFGGRLVLILLGWSAIGILAAGFGPQNRIASGLSIAFYAISVHLASIDWIMSLEPQWTSTSFGAMFAITQIGLAVALVLVTDAGRTAGSRDDFSKLVLATILGLVYMQFMQFLVQWSGNLPEKVAYYVLRGSFPWNAISVVGLLFAASAFAILSRTALRREQAYGERAADCALVFIALFLFWEFAPPFRDAASAILSLLSIGGAVMVCVALTGRAKAVGHTPAPMREARR